MKYEMTKDKKELFSALVLLDAIYDKGYQFRLVMGGDDIPLEPIFLRMRDKGLVDVRNGQYVVTPKGEELIQNFYQRFQDFLKVYDIYCAVDLVNGVFAFEKILELSDEDWQNYLNQDIWEDVRVAVCEFKKIDPMEIVFMSFLRENRIDLQQKGWQRALYSGEMWDEIVKICENAVPLELLLKDDQIQNMIKAGSDLLKWLIEQEKAQKEQMLAEAQSNGSEEVTTITEEVTTVEENYNYYSPYWGDDIYYVSPCWGLYYYDPYWW